MPRTLEELSADPDESFVMSVPILLRKLGLLSVVLLMVLVSVFRGLLFIRKLGLLKAPRVPIWGMLVESGSQIVCEVSYIKLSLLDALRVSSILVDTVASETRLCASPGKFGLASK